MVVTNNFDVLLGQPTVVIDRVSMVYRVASKEATGRRSLPLRRRMVEVHALKSVSLVVDSGEAVGIIGRNGSGKSTLMKLINGRVPPTGGAIYASAKPTLLGVSAALMPDLTGRENITLGCLAMGMTKSQIAVKYQDIVDLSGLQRSIDLPMRTYSSGMGSRLQFAIATAIDPEILLIDEALNTGDDQFKGRTKQKMNDLRRKAGCVFVVSHSESTIRELCTRVIWLDEGEVLMDGNPGEVTKWYRVFIKHLTEGNRVAAMKTRRRVQKTLAVPELISRQSGRRSAE